MKKTFQLMGLMLLALLATFTLQSCRDDDPTNDSDAPVKAEAGGTVTVGAVKLEFPADAFSGTLNVTAKEIDKPTDLGTNVLPLGMIKAVVLGPSGTQFLKPVTVTLPLSKTTESDKLSAMYWNEKEQAWMASSSVTMQGSNAVFTVNHFSTYAVCNNSVDEVVNTMKDDVHAGKSVELIFQEFQQRVDEQLDDLFAWDVIDGRYYQTNNVFARYSYYKKDEAGSPVVDALGTYSIGTAISGWNGFNRNAEMLFTYDAETDEFVHVDNSTYAKLKVSGNESYFYGISLEQHLVPSVLTGSLEGEINYKGDKTTVRFRLNAKTDGETRKLKVQHDNEDLVSGYSNHTLEGSYDRIIEMPYADESLGENPPMAGQKLKLSVSDSKAIKLSATEVTTDENGEAEVTITALKEGANCDIIAQYDYTGHAESDHSETTVHVGTSTKWQVTGVITEIAENEDHGTKGIIDYSIEFDFDLKDIQNLKVEDGTIPGVYTTATISASYLDLSNGNNELEMLYSKIEYEPSTQELLTYSVKTFVSTEVLDTYGYLRILFYDPTDISGTLHNNLANYDIISYFYNDEGMLYSTSTSNYSWRGPFLMQLPLKEENYSPLLLKSSNTTYLKDGKNCYLMCSGGEYAGTTKDINGNVTISKVE